MCLFFQGWILNTLANVYATFSYAFTDISVAFIYYWLFWITLLWISLCKYLLWTPLRIALVVYCQVGWLDHMVIWFTTLWGTSIPFSIVIASYAFPLAVHKGPISLHPFQHVYFFCCCSCLIVGSGQVRGDDSLIYIILMNSEVEHLSCALSICVYFLDCAHWKFCAVINHASCCLVFIARVLSLF